MMLVRMRETAVPPYSAAVAAPGWHAETGARQALAPLNDWAIGVVRAPLAALIGVDDAAALLARAQAMQIRPGAPLVDGWRNGRLPSADDRATLSQLFAFGVFLAQLAEPSLHLSSFLVDEMRGGTRMAYRDHAIGQWHTDDMWRRAIMHLHEDTAGTQWVVGDTVSQLHVGELLLLTGTQRRGTVPTLHAAPITDQSRRIVLYDFATVVPRRKPPVTILIHHG